MRLRHIVLALILVAGFVYITTWSPQGFFRSRWIGALPWEKGTSPVTGVTLAQSGGLTNDEQNNIQVYQAASPAVVNITTIALSYDWFLNAVPVEAGAGSGFIIDPRGDIVTNFHVIAEAPRNVQVTLADKRQFKATIVGRDQRSDLAVIHISAGSNLPSLQLGDSKHLQVGQKVLAIGNPFGQFQNTLTTGVISSIGRNVRDRQSGVVLEDVLQTDAAINPGNSGGPLLDSHGRVVGINSAIIGEANVGIGFAIPVDRVKLVVGDLLREHKVVRPYLGVRTLALNRDLADVLRLPVDQGLLVISVAPGSPADKAGIKGGSQTVVVGNYEIPVGGDILQEIDGDPLLSQEDIIRKIEYKRAGDTVKVALFRGSKKMTIDVRLEVPPANRF